jgi:hypothetical protein
MQVVYRARSIADARKACSVLAEAGITTHIADQALWEVAGQRRDADVIRVLVDNHRLDDARRALQGWVKFQVPALGAESAPRKARTSR